MNQIRRVLRSEYVRSVELLDSEAVAAALDRVPERVGRRRRASAVSASATAAVAAIAVVWGGLAIAGAADGGGSPAAPVWELLPDGRPEWCDLSTYPLPNPEAIPHTGFVGRQYVDYRGDSLEVTWVTPEGEVIRGVPDSDGDVFISSRGAMPSDMFVPGMYMVSDTFGNGSGGSGILSDGPALGYEWTTVVPEDTPPGVNRLALLQAHTLTIGYGGSGLPAAAVPEGATIETVFRWLDGREQRVELRRDDAGASLRDYSGLASAAIVVTGLPDGATYEITSYYDESLTWENACGVELEPHDDERRAEETGPLEGPESSVFQCGVRLPSRLEDAWEPSLQFGQGSVYDESQALWFDYGARGVAATATLPDFPYTPADDLGHGWTSSWREQDGERIGARVYGSVVLVDSAGVVLATETRGVRGGDEAIPTRPGGAGAIYTYASGSRTTTVTLVFGDIDGLGERCAGVEDQQLIGAAPVLLLGRGGSPDQMEWSWVRLDR